MPRDIVLTTPRLVLTTWVPGDVDALLDVHSDPETMRFVRHGRPESRSETVQLVDRYIAEHAARGWTKWRLADVDGGLVGRAGFGGDTADRQLAFVVRRSHCRLGLATEIAEALVVWHLTQAGGAPLRAIAAVGNQASIRVLQKVGFVEVGTEDFDGTACLAFVHREPPDGQAHSPLPERSRSCPSRGDDAEQSEADGEDEHRQERVGVLALRGGEDDAGDRECERCAQ